MKGLQKITIVLFALLLLASCSRKKNTFLTRNFHAVTAEFNALYNGGLALEKGQAELALTYRDNFWEVLPVERLELKEEEDAPGEAPNPDFERAEEKAAKAIQKHSIYLGGKEYNPQIDEAYMMLGKARYFDQRFIPAMDAFNFILTKYPTSNSINAAKVWKAKANIRLSNEDIAIEDLTDMMKREELDDEAIADASAILAQAFINLDSLDAALPYIKMASEYIRDNELKGRYAFIKGQIYNRLEFKDSANMAFDEVIELNRKSPRVYMINAYIEKARNFNYDKEDKVAFLELLFDLEENRENRPFLDRIYNQIGEYYLNTENIDTAVIYYNKSIKNYKDDRIMQSVNYSTLAEINFNDAEYKTAGKYYDSTLTFLEENTRSWRRFKKKRENLDDVIKYEDIAALHDSLLKLAAMSEAQQLAFFTEYTTKLKQKAIEDSIAAVKQEQKIANNEFYKKQTTGQTTDKTQGGGTFYFYNTTTVAFGKQEFRRIWGDRALEDNWRRSEKRSSGINNEEVATADDVPISENEMFKPETYIAQIPKDPKVIDSLTKDRDFAYYQLGLIYKEKFKEYGLAASKLERLLSNKPEERLVLPSKYNLVKIYQQLENEILANQYIDDILTNHSDSRYAEILRNPNAMLATDESSPEFKYKALYKEFEASNYMQVIETADEYINLYNGTDIVPKLEMLKATALARKDGYEAYKTALNFIALNYPNADEGKQAQEIYDRVLPTLKFTDFVGEEESDEWKVAYKFKPDEMEAAEALKKKLDEALLERNYFEMTTSIDYYDPDTRLVVVHGLNTKLGARGFAQVLNESKKYKIKRPFFEISSPNYKIVQIHKNLDAYLNADSVE